MEKIAEANGANLGDESRNSPVTTDILNFLTGTQEMFQHKFATFIVKELTDTKILKSLDDKRQ